MIVALVESEAQLYLVGIDLGAVMHIRDLEEKRHSLLGGAFVERVSVHLVFGGLHLCFVEELEKVGFRIARRALLVALGCEREIEWRRSAHFSVV